jgi:phosphotransferase system enzyme I (PtsI)
MADPERVLVGTPGAGGRAAGPLYMVEGLPLNPTIETTDPLADMRAAAERAARDLQRMAEAARARNPQGADVLEAQALMMRDPAIDVAVTEALAAGTSLTDAVRDAFERYAGRLDELGDEYLGARAEDVREAARLLLAALAGAAPGRLADLRRPSVVVAQTLSAADTLGVHPGLVLAIVTETGGATSHAAIVARELGIPAVLGVPDAIRAAAGAGAAEVDGDAGTVRLRAEAPVVAGHGAGRHLDLEDLPVRLMANASSAGAVAAASRQGALGIGLFRTELLFLGRGEQLPESDQEDIYFAVATTVAPYPAVVRTLDAGSDKALPALTARQEPNPALGLRGIRLWLAHPELARPQARALVRAGARCPNLLVMLPMIAAVNEVQAARWLFDEEAAGLGLAAPPLGIVLETPAAAAGLAAFRGLVEFISLGTNDLAQYALAADREIPWNDELTEWNPGVLRLIEQAVRASIAMGIPCGACGEMAGTPEGAVFLTGLGVASLSMDISSLERAAGALRRTGRQTAGEAARAAMTAPTAATARETIARTLRTQE